MRRTSIIRSAGSTLFGIGLGLLIAEVVLQIASPAPSIYRSMPPNLTVTFDAGRYANGIVGPALFKVNSMGVRSREWSVDRSSEYRILCLGGSTTESLLNDQSRIWTTLLEQKLGRLPDGRQPWVGNIGKAGLASNHHIVQLKHIDVYNPDLVIALVGSSDLMSRLKLGPETDSAAATSEDEQTLVEQSFSVFPGRSLFDVQPDWYTATRLWHFASTFTRNLSNQTGIQDTEGRSLERWRAMRQSGKRSNVLPPLKSALDAYERNLKEMLHLADISGFPIVLMSQPSIWRTGLTDAEKKQLWMGGVGEFRDVPGSLYYEPEALERGIDAYNQRLLKVCLESDASCVDLASAIPKNSVYFYDDEHFTDKGQEVVATYVAEAIRHIVHRSGLESEGAVPVGPQSAITEQRHRRLSR